MTTIPTAPLIDVWTPAGIVILALFVVVMVLITVASYIQNKDAYDARTAAIREDELAARGVVSINRRE